MVGRKESSLLFLEMDSSNLMQIRSGLALLLQALQETKWWREDILGIS